MPSLHTNTFWNSIFSFDLSSPFIKLNCKRSFGFNSKINLSGLVFEGWNSNFLNSTASLGSPLVTASLVPGADEDGNRLVNGPAGKIASWVWLLSGLGLLLYGFLILWRQGSIEKLLATLVLITVGTNWAISLMTIGDHRFRIPIMGMSLFLQAVGLKTLFNGGKAPMVDGPALR